MGARDRPRDADRQRARGASRGAGTRREQLALARRVRCPVLVISAPNDKITAHADAKALARGDRRRPADASPTAATPRTHASRSPVNLALRELVEGAASRRQRPAVRDPTVHRADGRPRALYVSSPIGLGHAQRDVAIARELRALVPDLQIDWLAQDPVTKRPRGARASASTPRAGTSPTSRGTSSPSRPSTTCTASTRSRRMDEILIANFMVFHDVAREERYDLWIADEGWEIDYYLHEHPGEKRAATRG